MFYLFQITKLPQPHWLLNVKMELRGKKVGKYELKKINETMRCTKNIKYTNLKTNI